MSAGFPDLMEGSCTGKSLGPSRRLPRAGQAHGGAIPRRIVPRGSAWPRLLIVALAYQLLGGTI
jgi:hypothetical protein